jgi:hypothetical protein
MVASTAVSFVLANIPCAALTMSHQPRFFTRSAFLRTAAAAIVTAFCCIMATRHGSKSIALIVAGFSGLMMIAVSVSLMSKRAT